MPYLVPCYPPPSIVFTDAYHSHPYCIFSEMEIIFLTIILGATILLALYIGKIFKPAQKEEAIAEDNDKEEEDTKQEKEVTTAKTKKKVADKKMKEKAPTFHHPWLVSTLKGHSGRVVDMEISPNGKHLASSGEVSVSCL